MLMCMHNVLYAVRMRIPNTPDHFRVAMQSYQRRRRWPETRKAHNNSRAHACVFYTLVFIPVLGVYNNMTHKRQIKQRSQRTMQNWMLIRQRYLWFLFHLNLRYCRRSCCMRIFSFVILYVLLDALKMTREKKGIHICRVLCKRVLLALFPYSLKYIHRWRMTFFCRVFQFCEPFHIIFF